MDEESKIMISTSKISIKKGLNCGWFYVFELGQNQTFRSSQKYGFNNKYDMTCQSRYTLTYNISNNRL
ncbi:hypothetical protein CLI69_11495 [Prevotella intermedia]|nr:hypothetical protein CLI69_11495 [Prevotella intermedia]